MGVTERVAGDLYILDTGMLGLERYGALYILKAPQPAIIETGFSHTLDKTLQALDELEIRRQDVAYIMPTHVHLDHAGGTGHLAEACPNATVIVHEQGAPHVIDPTKLLESVQRAVGPLFPFYGTLKPTPKERVLSVKGGEVFHLGDGYELEVIAAPGHAPHQVCFFERKLRGLFTADAAGIYRPWGAGLLLTTPPPAFHLEQSLETLARLKALHPKLLLYTHWGAHTDISLLDQYAQMLQDWVSEIERAKKTLTDDQAVKEHFVQRETPRLKEHYPELILRGEIEMNVQGVLLYLKRFRGIT
ncbi:Hydroxyacylglutathione hydrolase [bacterium HR07]|uniref:Zn-dependent hydrolase n=2 Tax=Candidatus Bipolaricaulota TaxID=67810 RepID=H5SF76_9BACT|nr:Zn-dependent hydrolase [uncultured Acetothermia bacterium]BAL58196.1 Zn-dependent hydrolase [uncultured Acetothermia bacterium]BAL59892.1 Zn-dependent hydrolase [Candidatus Acetothermum autotrophicum]GBC76501.1 Hydroxyacylglutathione hydrolase [bacterium HR07]